MTDIIHDDSCTDVVHLESSRENNDQQHTGKIIVRLKQQPLNEVSVMTTTRGNNNQQHNGKITVRLKQQPLNEVSTITTICENNDQQHNGKIIIRLKQQPLNEVSAITTTHDKLLLLTTEMNDNDISLSISNKHNKKMNYYNSQKLHDRLYGKTTIKENHNYFTPCLDFMGIRGYIRVYGKSERAIKLSYAISHKILIEDIPKYDANENKLYVCHGHGCTPNCIEPSHISLSTRYDDVYNANLQDKLYEKTISRVNPNYVKPCLEFIGLIDKSGYGMITAYGKLERAHRVSYALYHNISVKQIPTINECGQILEICHGNKCSRCCIEPTHLSLKTHYCNMYEDKLRDGTLLRGNNHPNSKISEELAQQIKLSKYNGTQKERAMKFGVPEHIIHNIDQGKSWAFMNNIDECAVNNMLHNQINHIHKNKNEELSSVECINALKILREKSADSINIHHKVTTPCHLFQGYLNDDGYGQISFAGIRYMAHILAYKARHHIKCMDITMKVCHMCDTKQCCNPEHLILKDRRHNSLDMLDYSKQVKLIPEKVLEIKRLLNVGNMTNKQISEQFHVSVSTISGIKMGRTWTHVN